MGGAVFRRFTSSSYVGVMIRSFQSRGAPGQRLSGVMPRRAARSPAFRRRPRLQAPDDIRPNISRPQDTDRPRVPLGSQSPSAWPVLRTPPASFLLHLDLHPVLLGEV